MQTKFAIAVDPAFVGILLYHQVVQAELGGWSQITGIQSSNGLELTVGTFGF